MGANMLNTMLEALKPVLEELSQGQSLMGILSNYATDSLVTASCRIAFRYLSRQRIKDERLRRKLRWLVSLRRLILTELLLIIKEFLMVLMRF